MNIGAIPSIIETLALLTYSDEFQLPCPSHCEEPHAHLPMYDSENFVSQLMCLDYEDVASMDQWIWRDYPSVGGYAIRSQFPEGIIMSHRQLLGIPLHGHIPEVDHKDGCRVHNCRHNLRLCTQTQNAQNRASRKGSSSQYIGVSWSHRYNRWRATVVVEGKVIFDKYYRSEEEAAKQVAEIRKRMVPWSIER